MGNPLYRSPLYNDSGDIYVYDNRFTAWHLAATGIPTKGLRYRLMCTFQRGLGTYKRPFANPHNNVSLLAEAAYSFTQESEFLKGVTLKGAFGADRGPLLGNNIGFQLTVAKTLGLCQPLQTVFFIADERFKELSE